MKRGEARRIINQAVEKAVGKGIRKDWITINGTHVEINDDGEVVNGPSGLKGGGDSKGGGSKGSSKAGGKAGSGDKNKIVDGKIPNMTYMKEADKEKLKEELVKTDAREREPQLKKFEKELLQEGNQSEFASLVLDYYPDICETCGFTESDSINNYKSDTDFTDDEYVLYNDNNNDKYLFNTSLEFRGVKSYD